MHLLLEQAVVGHDGGGEVLAHALHGLQHRWQRGIVVLRDDLQHEQKMRLSNRSELVMCTIEHDLWQAAGLGPLQHCCKRLGACVHSAQQLAGCGARSSFLAS